MKFHESGSICSVHVVELTRRNLRALMDKLDDPLSSRSLLDPDLKVMVTAVEDVEHYADREPGPVFMPTTGEVR